MMVSKSQVVPESMVIFRESDKREFKEKFDDSDYSRYVYTNSAKIIKERLAIMGYTLNKARRTFDEERKGALQELKDRYDEDKWLPLLDRIKILETATFNKWVKACKYISVNKLEFDYSYSVQANAPKGASPLVKYLLTNDDYGSFGFPGSDIYDVFRIFLEFIPDNTPITMDISDLVNGGYYESNEKVCDNLLNSLTYNYPINEKIIILTEGSSDKRILESSLPLLFPHLAGYYSFMNFEDSNAAGGAGYLLSTIRAFAGSGITNRIIAIFDNDTAGGVAIQSLRKTKIPRNIKVMQYPNIKIAKKYPTLGPSGVKLLDINGLACSLEIYLGRDVLENTGKLRPVQWRGYDNTLNQYQGEIIGKNEIQEKFSKKLSVCTKNPALLKQKDWEDLSSLFGAIFKAFQE